MIKESFFTFLTQIFTAFLGFLVAVFMARTLGPEGKGIYAFLQDLLAISLLIGSLGITIANTYFAGSKKHPLKVLFGNSLVFGVLLGTLLIVGVLGLSKFFPELFKGISPFFIFLIALSLPFRLISNFLQSLILGLQQIVSYNLAYIIDRTINALAIISLLFLFPGIQTAVWILCLMGVIIFFVTLTLFLKKNPFEIKPSSLVIKDSIKFGFRGQLGSIAKTINLKLGIFLLNFFLDPNTVGIYSVALLLATSLKFVPDSLGTVLFPKVSTFGKDSEAERLVDKCSRISFLLTVLAGIGLIIISPFVIKIFFGQAFMPALNPLRILIGAMMIFSVSQVLGSYIAGKGFPQYHAVASVVALFFSFSISLVAIPSLGASGSAIATLISYFVTLLIFLGFYKKVSPEAFSLKKLLIPQKQDFKTIKLLLDKIRWFRI